MTRAALILLPLPILSACLERRISVVSDPPGALVTINDTEVGRTPLTTSFDYYGSFDVQVRKEGFESVSSGRRASTPIYEIPPIDLVATALPVPLTTTKTWTFTLTPSPASLTRDQESELLSRARDLRDRTLPPAK